LNKLKKVTPIAAIFLIVAAGVYGYTILNWLKVDAGLCKDTDH